MKKNSTIMLFFGISVIMYAACHAQKKMNEKPGAIQNTTEQADSSRKYHLFVSFTSIGMGIDRDTQEAFARYLETKGIQPEIYHWGREGETDYCIDLSGRKEDERQSIIREIKELLQKGKWIDTKENAECLRKNR